MENCDASKGFGFIYIYIDDDLHVIYTFISGGFKKKNLMWLLKKLNYLKSNKNRISYIDKKKNTNT